jgi:hypothetical protein
MASTNRLIEQMLKSQQPLAGQRRDYVEGTHRGAARLSRTLIANKVDQAARGIVDIRTHGVPFSVVTGVQPIPYFGEGVDDVESFIESCQQCMQANNYPVKRVVANLSYYATG